MLNRDLLQRARTAHVALSLTITFGLLGGIITALQAKTFSHIVNAAFLQHSTRPSLTTAFLTLLALISLRAISAALSETLADRAARRIKHQLRRDLLHHIQNLPIHHTQQQRTGSLTNTLTEAIESLDPYLREYLPQLAQASLLPASLLLLVFPRDPISAVILLLTGPLIPLFMALIGNMAQRATQKQWRNLNRLSTHFWDVLHGLTTLKLFNRSRTQTAAIRQASDQHRRLTLNVLKIAFLSALTLELLSTLSTALIAVGIGIRLLYGQLNFEDALFVLLLAPEFYLPLRLLGTRFHAGITGSAAAQEIFAALSTPVPQPPASPAKTPTNPLPVTFDNVTYTHPGDTQPTLHNINFSLQTGQTIALVGPSGSGKTTLANLLLGFIQPTSGQILAHGIPLHQLCPTEWRAHIGWVPQTPYLLQDTLQANLLLAKPHATQPQIETAARAACLLPILHNLPRGWHTPLGENGTRLSSGEAQRLAIGRAFLKDAPILLLDEATAALDPALDAEIQTSLTALSAGRATLLIAHRLHTAIRADQILVLEQGHIVQRGTHSQLFAQPGLYRDLWQTYQRENVPQPPTPTLPPPHYARHPTNHYPTQFRLARNPAPVASARVCNAARHCTGQRNNPQRSRLNGSIRLHYCQSSPAAGH